MTNSTGVTQLKIVDTKTLVVRPKVVDSAQLFSCVTCRVAKLEFVATLAAFPAALFVTAMISELVSPNELARSHSRTAELILSWT